VERSGERRFDSKRLPREDREVFQVPIDVRRLMRLGEEEALTNANVFQLKALALLGVFNPGRHDLQLALLSEVH
jgi:hypothetical protein